jgi:hypothetical protein
MTFRARSSPMRWALELLAQDPLGVLPEGGPPAHCGWRAFQLELDAEQAQGPRVECSTVSTMPRAPCSGQMRFSATLSV